jgi:hypothetical protein
MEPVPVAERDDVRAYVRKAADAYPYGLIKSAGLSQVAAVQKLLWEGTSFGGTIHAQLSTVILAVDALPQREKTVTRNIHHEFCHLVRSKFGPRFPKREWLALNPPAYRYPFSGGMEALQRQRTGKEMTDEVNARGFVNEYGESALEEDAATIAETLMAADPEEIARLHRFPKLRAKCDLIIRFYRSVDPAFEPPKAWVR